MLENQSVLVTGGGTGIGRATVKSFADRGATVLSTDVDESAAEATADECSECEGNVSSMKLDVTERADFDNAVAELEQQCGQVDVLVNNAAIDDPQPFLEASVDDLRQTFEINVVGVWNGCQAVIPSMIDAGGGAVVNVASIGSFRGWQMRSLYCLTKGAVLNFTRSLADEFGSDDIRVNAVCPGTTETPRIESHYEETIERLFDVDGQKAKTTSMNQYPMERFANPDEIANAIIFLASDEASFVTGHEFIVDGGYTVR